MTGGRVTLQSWGGLKSQQSLWQPTSRHDGWQKSAATYLPYGLGRSYGDSCLNEAGTAILTRGMKRLLAFDPDSGDLHCEAGLSLGELAAWALPRGFFLPVSPGTRFVTVGGAIANDIHGKNHHQDGSFGEHVRQLQLRRSDGSQIRVSAEHHAELFAATVGGLGLTGLITDAVLRLRPVPGPYLEQEQLPFSSLQEGLQLAAESHAHPYVVSWVDCLSATQGGGLRGILYRARHAEHPAPSQGLAPSRWPAVPFDFPAWVLSGPSVRAFNLLYRWKGGLQARHSRVPLWSFFYPLDAVPHWNRIYGRGGLLQYQCVVPFADAEKSLAEILSAISRAGLGSFLAVLKSFGSRPAPGLLSFPRPGVTLALDFRRDQAALDLFERLDAVVREAGGALYPAKDQRMSPALFEQSFPRLGEFILHIDPRFSSSFWRRVQPSEVLR